MAEQAWITPKVRQAVAYFQSQGWSPQQAAGIVANLHAESALDEHNNTGDGGLAFGIGQWRPDRQGDFRKWAGYPIQGSTFEKQLEFVRHELAQGLSVRRDGRWRAKSRRWERAWWSATITNVPPTRQEGGRAWPFDPAIVRRYPIAP